MVFRGRTGVSECACCFLGCAQGGQPQTAAVGAYAANGPGIVSLIRIATLFRYPAAMIELSKIRDGFLHPRPHSAEKDGVVVSRQHIVAIDHQYKFRMHIVPDIRVLPSGLVDVTAR